MSHELRAKEAARYKLQAASFSKAEAVLPILSSATSLLQSIDIASSTKEMQQELVVISCPCS